MGVRVVFPDMGKDPSVQLIEKTITENGTYDALTDGANGYSKVNVNVEGGGGSSDFSTAEVTVTGVLSPDLPTTLEVNVATVAIPPIADDGSSVPSGVWIIGQTYKVILSKGKARLYVVRGTLTIPSGETNITYDSDDVYLITGDCTITIS